MRNATLDITGGTFTITNATGYQANAGTTKVEAGATLNVLPSTLANSGTLTNLGSLDLNNTTITAGNLSNNGTINIQNGGASTFNSVTLTKMPALSTSLAARPPRYSILTTRRPAAARSLMLVT